MICILAAVSNPLGLVMVGVIYPEVSLACCLKLMNYEEHFSFKFHGELIALGFTLRHLLFITFILCSLHLTVLEKEKIDRE